MTEKFEFIDGEKQNYSLTAMFTWLAVSSSGFYEWRDRPESATAARRGELVAFIQHVFADSDGTYALSAGPRAATPARGHRGP